MSSYIQSTLSVSGEELEPGRCTAAAGVEPSTVFERTAPHFHLPRWQWIYRTERVELESVDDSVRQVRNALGEGSTRLASFARDGGHAVNVECSVPVYEDKPLYELLPETVAYLHAISARFGIDIYDYTED